MFEKNVRTVAGVYGSSDFIGEIDVQLNVPSTE